MSTFTAPEEWKELPEWPGYQVSDLGRIRCNKPLGGRGDNSNRSPTEWRILKGGNDKDGYRKFTLKRSTKEPFQSCIRMCGTVATLFHGPRPKGHVIAHINGVNTDDRACNLKWKSQSDNIADKNYTELCKEELVVQKVSYLTDIQYP